MTIGAVLFQEVLPEEGVRGPTGIGLEVCGSIPQELVEGHFPVTVVPPEASLLAKALGRA
jgi:hypothetical protein